MGQFEAHKDLICRTVEPRVKFVDDLSIAEIIKIFNEIVHTLQEKLDTLSSDCTDVNFVLNPGKCFVMHIIPPKRQFPIVLPDLHVNNTPLPVVHECVLLGLHLNDELTWGTHVNHILSKASQSIFMLYRAKKFGFSVSSMITIFNWFVRTPLEYAAPTWHPGLNETDHQRIERIQRRCYRIILGREYISYDDAIQSLRSCTLRERRESLTLRFGRSLLRSPQHREPLPPTLAQVHGRNTRNRNNLALVPCATERYRNSTIPYVVRLLNGLQ